MIRCEFCGDSDDIGILRVVEFKVYACISCTRKVDEVVLISNEDLRAKIRAMMFKFPEKR